jgi:predicted DNA-binding protein
MPLTRSPVMALPTVKHWALNNSISFKVQDSLCQRLDAAAVGHRLSRAQFIRKVLEEHLDEHERTTTPVVVTH